MKITSQHQTPNTVKLFNNVKLTTTYYLNKYQGYLLLFIGK
jgi:hypothetical protein